MRVEPLEGQLEAALVGTREADSVVKAGGPDPLAVDLGHAVAEAPFAVLKCQVEDFSWLDLDLAPGLRTCGDGQGHVQSEPRFAEFRFAHEQYNSLWEKAWHGPARLGQDFHLQGGH